VSWLVGFALGALGGFVLGCLKGPAALGRLRLAADPFGGGPTGHGGDEAGDRPRRGKRLTGLLLDEQLARSARQRLAERGLTNRRVDVTIVDGVAYLRGRVPEAADAAAIAETVQATPGLTDVVNELKLPAATAS
jgi:BON domain-containing protein